MKEQKNIELEIELSKKEGYPEFESIVANSFKNKIDNGNFPLFTVEIENLWNIFIKNIEPNRQEHYQCNACRRFIQRFGGLVTITQNGKVKSLLWDIEVPEFFKKSVEEMKKAVESAEVDNIFISDVATLGEPATGIWTHLHVKLPSSKVNRSRLKTAKQIVAEKREEYGMVTRALEEYSLDTVNKAFQLLNSESLYRSDRCLGVAKNFKELIEVLNETRNEKAKNNLKWLYVAIVPSGHCRIKSSMIGTLLDDIQSGLDSRIVAARFAEKMNPSNYMRSQSAPTMGNILQAEKIVAKLGIANSLQRRFATIDEIQEFVWKNRNKTIKPKETGVFGHLTPKTKASVDNEYHLPQTVMTWEKFARTVLPNVDNIEVKVDNPSHLMALVTAVHNDAENILQWNNPFSWYYHGGIDAEIKQRVEENGGRHEDNEIRCSLMWNGLTDLDLHCINPVGEHIFYSEKRDRYDGWLDLDMNGLDKNSTKPVENMRWVKNAPNGRYKFYVHNFSERVNHFNGTPFVAELEVNGQVFTYHGDALKNDKEVTVFEFDYNNGQVTMISDNKISNCSTNEWNIDSNTFVRVNGITTSPNLWGNSNAIHSGTHIFFLLDGCKDTSEGKGRGLFVETLKPEFHEIRKTLEAYMATAIIEDVDNASACGVGYSKDSDWNLVLKVTTDNVSRIIKIDRWD